MNSQLAPISDQTEKRAKTNKGKRYLKQFEAQLNEGPRKCLLLKGSKTSNKVSNFLKLWVRSFLT